jgi:hypothetical protein
MFLEINFFQNVLNYLKGIGDAVLNIGKAVLYLPQLISSAQAIPLLMSSALPYFVISVVAVGVVVAIIGMILPGKIGGG